MNDEAGSSSAVPLDAPPRRSTETSTAPIVEDATPSFYFSRKPRLQDLITVLDRVIWLEITIVYLLDNSFIRFALRSMVQAVYLMPKPKGFPEQNVPQPYVGGIAGTNLICVIFHLFNGRPEAGEAERGYLHGSLLLDFIGQQGPTSKLRLVLLDVVIMILQFVALAAISEKQDLDSKKPSEETAQASSNGHSNNQDHDAEERGELRGTSLGTDGIELQDLGSTELTAMLQDLPAQNHIFSMSDNIASGQAIIGDFYIMDSAKQMYREYENRRREQRESDARVAEGGLAAMHGLRQRISEQLSNRGTPG